MKKFPIALAAVALIAAGCFAAASIASGGSFVRMLTGTTETTDTVTTPTETNEHGSSSGRRVTMCHRTGSKKKGHFKYHTITVDQHAVAALERHGDTAGACTTPSTSVATSTTTSDSSSSHDASSNEAHGNSNGHGSDHGNSGSDHGKGHGKP